MNLKKLRKKVGITQKEAAARIGIAQSTVSMWETGESLPKTETLPEIAKVYNCTIQDLFDASKST